MSSPSREVYAGRALSQIPRLLSLQDRNPYSPTYGCFKRTYWLDKTADFPDALPQYGVLSLALAYHHEMPGNIFKDQEKIRDWILAGMRFWTRIQHRDGSFDEFYPNEHGWTGPTGFLLYAMLKSFMILDERKEFPTEFQDEFFMSCRKAAQYIIQWDEHGVLANHHAMAVLPVYYAYHVLQQEDLLEGYEKKLTDFLKYHTSEGWSLEYDGADIGYLSATVSFLGKVYKINNDQRLKKVMEESINFLSYFVYPNGFYAGSIGSRNTLHFYSHGCEILASQLPLAGRIADAMLESLRDGKIVPAEIQSDRYFLYRIPEHLESYIDYGERVGKAELPYEGGDFRSVFKEGRFYIEKNNDLYLVGNAAKGGVVKLFYLPKNKILVSDCGVIGKTHEGDVLTSQWIDPDYTFTPKKHGFSVAGSLHSVPANKLFTPMKLIIFRVFLLLFGWHTGVAYRIKGLIRKLLMLKSGKSSVFFYRGVELTEDGARITDSIKLTGELRLESLRFGDEFFTRYVPQSRYFQRQEFDTHPFVLSADYLDRLNSHKRLRIQRTISVTGDEKCEELPWVTGAMGIEYSEGRKTKKSLVYRMHRRTDEVLRMINKHYQGIPKDLLDIGPAEGRLMSIFKDRIPKMNCMGLEFSQELIDSCMDPRLNIVQGDAMHPPFSDESFDVITATAIIEHVSNPGEFLVRIAKMLRPGGIVIITTPDPFFEHIATAIGHIDDEEHQETMTLNKLKMYIENSGLKPVQLEKFMCSPWGCPKELFIENLMKRARLGFLLLNQLAVGKKLSDKSSSTMLPGDY